MENLTSEAEIEIKKDKFERGLGIARRQFDTVQPHCHSNQKFLNILSLGNDFIAGFVVLLINFHAILCDEGMQ